MFLKHLPEVKGEQGKGSLAESLSQRTQWGQDEIEVWQMGLKTSLSHCRVPPKPAGTRGQFEILLGCCFILPVPTASITGDVSGFSACLCVLDRSHDWVQFLIMSYSHSPGHLVLQGLLTACWSVTSCVVLSYIKRFGKVVQAWDWNGLVSVLTEWKACGTRKGALVKWILEHTP